MGSDGSRCFVNPVDVRWTGSGAATIRLPDAEKLMYLGAQERHETDPEGFIPYNCGYKYERRGTEQSSGARWWSVDDVNDRRLRMRSECPRSALSCHT